MPAEGRLNTSRCIVASVPNHADAEVVTYFFRLCTLDRKVLQQAIDGVGDELCFRGTIAELRAGLPVIREGHLGRPDICRVKDFVHRSRLIDQKKKARRVCATDRGRVGHRKVSEGA